MTEDFPLIFPKQACPGCGYEMDSMRSIAPKVGDHTVCIRCGKLLEYDGTKLIEGDATTLSVENARIVARVQYAIKQIRR